ncbi:hypothetical protein D3C85_975350 [compost metagenome]
MSLDSYTADQLLAELKRRADEAELAKKVERWCTGCDKWRYSDRDDDPVSNCTKGNRMTFRMPQGHPDSDDEWGFYRIDCADWAERPADAPGPNLQPLLSPPPPPEPPRRRRSTRQPAHHASAITTSAPPGASPMLHPMHKRPRPGHRFAVHTKGGLVRHQCHATHVIADGVDAIVIYHGKFAIDEADAIGWWPETRL